MSIARIAKFSCFSASRSRRTCESRPGPMTTTTARCLRFFACFLDAFGWFLCNGNECNSDGGNVVLGVGQSSKHASKSYHDTSFNSGITLEVLEKALAESLQRKALSCG